VYRNVPLSFKPGGLSILTQCTPSFRDALAPAKDNDSQQQVGHRVAHQPQERPIVSQRPQRSPLKQGLVQDIHPRREREEARDRRHPARHTLQGDEHSPKDQHDHLEDLLEDLQALEEECKPAEDQGIPHTAKHQQNQGLECRPAQRDRHQHHQVDEQGEQKRAADIICTVSSYAIGYTMVELSALLPERSERVVEEKMSDIGRLTQVMRRLPRETPAHLVEVASVIMDCDLDAQFTFGLDLMLTSLKTRQK
jgi:hypothetical protein